MRSAGPRAATAGFLLPETLATFTISAAVLFCLVGGSAMLTMVSDRSISHVQTNDRFYQALHALTRDISHISRARWNGEEPQPYIFSGTENALLFAVEDNGPLFTTRKVIAIRPQGSGGGMTWREAELPPMAAQMGDLRFGSARPLDLAGARLRFSFIETKEITPGAPGITLKQDAAQPTEPARRVRQDIAHTAWPSKTSLPDAIIVEADDAQTGRSLAKLRIQLLINADIGCIKPESGTSAATAAANAGASQPVDGPPPGTPGAPAAPNAGGETFCSRTAPQTPIPQAPAAPGAPR